MKHWMSLALAICFIPSAYAGMYEANVLEEVLYQDFKQTVLTKNSQKINSRSGFTRFEQKLFVDAIWDMADEGSLEAIKALDSINTFHYDLIEKLRIGILRIKYKRALVLPEDLTADLSVVLLNPVVETKLIYTLAAYEEDILNAGHSDIIELAKNHKQYFDISEDEVRKKEITKDIVADLFHKTPDMTTYMNGEYLKSVKIFMFCRENRLYPCLMVMKNVHGETVRNADGSIWSHPALASSSRGLPSYTRNGNTPAGILTIDSVMPTADQQISFGKFRRMILNFVPKSKEEVLMKSLLPSSSHNEDWWRTSVTARDVGRSLFRIHGTGKINQDPTTPYYPFMRTSGCIAQRENTYGDVTYRDQRVLLNDIMKAMDMVPNYENEVKVKGILYLVEIDDLNDSVEAKDLALRGIE
jgi:hypothetical protein